jgi:biofilm PGA synthesis N-glycosyltransferase PgaC
MITIIVITSVIFLLYLLYPFWLTIKASDKLHGEIDSEEINGVSVILLSYNGKQYLNEKINFLIRELSAFGWNELIIIDDHSMDGSGELLATFSNIENVQILYNNKHRGIPFSMNLGIANAKYESVIFCDQRQGLSESIIKKIIEPLKYKDIGAVSGCITDMDKEHHCSIIRSHENLLKQKESKTGSLIGVYGPFYAIKKQCYARIPENIILDDLYLSLRILKSKKVVLREDCRITDDCFADLYNYKRTKRYLVGLLQILRDKSIIKELNLRQLTMLVWHKYLRLLIPFSLFLSYITLGLKAFQEIEYQILFTFFTVALILTILPFNFIPLAKLRNIIRLNVFYFIALIDLFTTSFFFQKKEPQSNEIMLPDLSNVKTK